ncbi:MAG: NAD(+)/NADH kinase [Pseudomonadota bacterium]
MYKIAALFGQPDHAVVQQQMQRVARWLADAGLRVLVAHASEAVVAERVDEAQLAELADLFIAIGGDGTMLYAARVAVGRDIPLLGINLGRLGFLTDISPDEVDDSLTAVLNDEALSETRLLLEATVSRGDERVATALAMNDVVLGRRDPGRMIDFETRVNGTFVNNHAGDGLIAATATGSTAYALSCGGPIMQPGVSAIALVPVCPHTLSDRPVVLPATVHIEVRRTERSQTPAEISVDGQFLATLEGGDTLTIKAAEQRLKLIHPPGYDYFELLRSKLNWGADSRRRDKGGPG